MQVDWGVVKDILNVAGWVGGIAAVVLVMWLRKYFVGKEEYDKTRGTDAKELENYLKKDRIEILYVPREKFDHEVQRLRNDLQTLVGSSAANTDRLLTDGLKQIRDDINGQGTRIDASLAKAQSAEAKADSSLELLRRTEADFGRMAEKMDNMNEKLGGVAESVGHIKGLMEKNRQQGGNS
jgi:hypothetical protein